MKKITVLSIISLVALTGCSSRQKMKDLLASFPSPEPRPAQIKHEEIQIPAIELCPIKGVNPDEADFTDAQLEALEELPLIKAPESKEESYRVTSLSVINNPVTALFFKNGDKYFIRYKRIQNCSWFNKEAKVTIWERETSRATWDKVKALIRHLDFWNLASMQRLNSHEGGLYDPQFMVIEGCCHGQYHCVIRMINRTCFSETYNELLDLAGCGTP